MNCFGCLIVHAHAFWEAMVLPICLPKRLAGILSSREHPSSRVRLSNCLPRRPLSDVGVSQGCFCLVMTTLLPNFNDLADSVVLGTRLHIVLTKITFFGLSSTRRHCSEMLLSVNVSLLCNPGREEGRKEKKRNAKSVLCNLMHQSLSHK